LKNADLWQEAVKIWSQLMPDTDCLLKFVRRYGYFA